MANSADWLKALNVRMIDVRLFDDHGLIVTEPHVDDITPIHETARMTLDRYAFRAAVYPYMGRWCLVCPDKPLGKRLRYYDTQEAAEMVAIHRG